MHLQNGSVILGKVIRIDSDSSMHVRTRDGSLWVFDGDEVKEVVDADPFAFRRNLEIPQKGFYNASSLGLMGGTAGDYLDVNLSAMTVNGYKINSHYSVGLGLGLESVYPAMLPVFLEGRYHLLEGRFTPFATLQGGYSIPIDNYRDSEGEWRYKGGVMADAQLGVLNYIGHSVALTFSLGYRFQQSIGRYAYYDPWGIPTRSTRTRQDFHFLVFRAGLLFN